MRITIICDEFNLEDVTALAQYLRGRYKDTPREIRVLVDSQEIPAVDAAAAMEAIFEGDPHWLQIIPFKGDNGNK